MKTLEFQKKLIEQNSLSNILSSAERLKVETSEERANKNHCTFKPNLNATRKMNMLLSSKVSPDINGIVRQNSPQIRADPNSTLISIRSNSTNNLNQTQRVQPMNKRMKELCYNNPVIFHVNLLSETTTVSKLNTLTKGGYSQKSLERKRYEQGVHGHPHFRVANFTSKPSNQLNVSRSEINLVKMSVASIEKPLINTDRRANLTKQRKKEILSLNSSVEILNFGDNKSDTRSHSNLKSSINADLMIEPNNMRTRKITY